jgi:methionyl-tRNA synthetase
MFYITSSRPYTNSTPHLGTAMDAVYADCFNRFFKRISDNATFFSMGTDEHSFKISDKATELNLSPKQFVDLKYQEFAEVYSQLDIQSDNFIQSSDPKHHWLANLVWEVLKSKDLIYKKEYHGLYCKGCEDFYAPSQLINGCCPIHTNLEIQKVSESNYFFRLSSFKQDLLNYLEQVVVSDQSVLTEMRNFAQDLQDISISRDRKRLSVDWGIPVWSDESQLMYVWFEALLTYLTPLIDDELYDRWHVEKDNQKVIEAAVWDQLNDKLPQDLHVIGRDNSKFHLIIYPAILFGLELPPISACLIHGMITDSQGRKFAKSLGNGVELSDFLEKVGKEGLRFFILHDCNSVGDTSFDWSRVIASFNANLADNLGNLVVRVTNLIEKNLDGELPENAEDLEKIVDLSNVYGHLRNLNPNLAFQELLAQATQINQYLEETRPWTLAKDKTSNLEQIQEILGKSATSLREIAIALTIFLPESGQNILDCLNREKIIKAPILFPKIEEN